MDESTARRRLLKAALGFGVALHVPMVSAQDSPSTIRPREGDFLVRADDPDLDPLTPEDIHVGEPQTLVWAMDPNDEIVRSGSRLNRVLLARFDASSLGPETTPRAADGVVGYTAICPHTGCEVVEWLKDEQLLNCPCHFSKFDPRNGARVIDGPAPRVLPALPLKLVEGKLVVAGGFTARVGFETA